jgi:plasmid stabilization system protein ParE
VIVTLHPLAQEELVAGAVHYSTQVDAALGQAFIEEFNKAVALLCEHPMLGPPWRGTLRRLPMRRFPYSLVYHVDHESLRILALAHQRRRPGYWRGRS